ncbi:MAG TPA: hypothetical protein VMT70_17560, partial [Vicinamibacteria bacterium]|nr:hypothetical protein [Vicinamibacteria bacterium]
MNYRRVLLVIDLEAGAGAAIDVVRRVAPDASLLLIVARFPASGIAWLSAPAPADLNAAATESLEALRSAARGVAEAVEVRVEAEVDARDVADIAEAASIDLLVTRSLPEIADVRKRRSLSVLWVAEATDGSRPIEKVLCVALGERARGAVGRFLRDHSTAGLRVTALVSRVSADVGSVLQIAGARTLVEQATRPPSGPFDLVVVARLPAAFLAALKWRAPVLVLPPVGGGRP